MELRLLATAAEDAVAAVAVKNDGTTEIMLKLIMLLVVDGASAPRGLLKHTYELSASCSKSVQMGISPYG